MSFERGGEFPEQWAAIDPLLENVATTIRRERGDIDYVVASPINGVQVNDFKGQLERLSPVKHFTEISERVLKIGSWAIGAYSGGDDYASQFPRLTVTDKVFKPETRLLVFSVRKLEHARSTWVSVELGGGYTTDLGEYTFGINYLLTRIRGEDSITRFMNEGGYGAPKDKNSRAIFDFMGDRSFGMTNKNNNLVVLRRAIEQAQANADKTE